MTKAKIFFAIAVISATAGAHAQPVLQPSDTSTAPGAQQGGEQKTPAGAQQIRPHINSGAAPIGMPQAGRAVGSENPAGICPTARTAAARLICADADLSARDTKLAAAYRRMRAKAPVTAQKQLQDEQLLWMRQRDQKCGLVGKDAAPLDVLRLARACMASEIEARLAQLQAAPAVNSPATVPTTSPSHVGANPSVAADDLTFTVPGARVPGPRTPGLRAPGAAVPRATAPSPAVPGLVAAPTSSPNAALPNQDVVITPLLPDTALAGAADTASGNTFHFSVPATGFSGTFDCGPQGSSPATNAPLTASGAAARPVIKIMPIDDASSFPVFANGIWRSPLDTLRQMIHAKCIAGSAPTSAGFQASHRLDEVYEVTSSRGLFVAHSTGIGGAWNVETNLPQTRKKLQADFGVQKWVKTSELARNPYFFKDMVVGVIVQLDHKISEREAVFARSDARIFVSGVPENFADREAVVLAGRVMGNKGVVDPAGNEQLMPAVVYLGAADCEKACEALSAFAAE